MEVLLIFIGLIIGVAAGFVFAIYCQVQMDKQAISDGVIKLCGRYFFLKEVET